jgi:[protein-PII] uridylyltransferase
VSKKRFLVTDIVIAELKKDLNSWKTKGLAESVQMHSDKIEKVFLEILEKCPEWEQSKPIALGSWGKRQLTVLSDIDLLFLGEEKQVLKVIEHARNNGFELRYRIPLDKQDWTVGVDVFDINSLIFGRPIFAADIATFEAQIAKIKGSRNTFKKIIGAIKSDRIKRHSAHFELAGHLEPHLKLGPGGARDAVHFFVLNFFRPNDNDLVLQMSEQNSLVLFMRQALALHGEVEHLRAQEQIDIYETLGFASTAQLMQQVVKALNCIKQVSDEQLSVLNKGKNYERQSLKISKKEIKTWKPQKLKTTNLAKIFFDSNIEEVFPNWGVVNGLVKHDQYHRFSTESHIFRAVNLVAEWSKKTPVFIKRFVKTFKNEDWQILFWAMWFHDIGKGSTEDHSTHGSRLVLQFFKQQKLSKDMAKEVAWLVENHLLLSTFAFRHNHHSSSVIAELKKRGVEGKALLRLLIVTVIDILATNPSAWNSWKEELLFKLTEHLLSPGVNRMGQLIEVASKKRIHGIEELLEHVNETVLLDLDPKVLVTDYSEVLRSKSDLPPKLYKDDRGQLWVRFHKKQDRPGVFLEFIQNIVMTGSQIRHSVVMTLPGGVYDWFNIRSTKDIEVLNRLFKSLEKAPAPRMEQFTNVRFKKVEMVSQNETEGIVSFKGIDQRGALMVAAGHLFKNGLEIKWAKVNTFGSQIDDVFGVKLKPDLSEIVGEIHNKLCSTQSVSPLKNELSLD